MVLIFMSDSDLSHQEIMQHSTIPIHHSEPKQIHKVPMSTMMDVPCRNIRCKERSSNKHYNINLLSYSLCKWRVCHFLCIDYTNYRVMTTSLYIDLVPLSDGVKKHTHKIKNTSDHYCYYNYFHHNKRNHTDNRIKLISQTFENCHSHVAFRSTL